MTSGSKDDNALCCKPTGEGCNCWPVTTQRVCRGCSPGASQPLDKSHERRCRPMGTDETHGSPPWHDIVSPRRPRTMLRLVLNCDGRQRIYRAARSLRSFGNAWAPALNLRLCNWIISLRFHFPSLTDALSLYQSPQVSEDSFVGSEQSFSPNTIRHLNFLLFTREFGIFY